MLCSGGGSSVVGYELRVKLGLTSASGAQAPIGTPADSQTKNAGASTTERKRDTDAIMGMRPLGCGIWGGDTNDGQYVAVGGCADD